MNRLKNKRSGIYTFSDYKQKKNIAVYIAIQLMLVFGIILAVAPLLWLFFSSFKAPSELYNAKFKLFPAHFSLSKITEVFKVMQFTKHFFSSMIGVIGAVICSILFNGLLAYAISVIKPFGSKLIFGLILLSYMIPAMTAMVPLYKSLLDIGLVGNKSGMGFWALWLVFGANAFYLMLFKVYFDSLPRSFFEAARLDGANDISIFYYIVLPLSKPIIGVISIFTMTASWSDFLLPYLLMRNTDFETVMVKIYRLNSTIGSSNFTEDQLLMALTISIIPQVVMFLLFQKQITGTVTATGIKE